MDSQTELRYRQSNRLLRLLLDNHTVEEVVETISYLMEKPVLFIDINFSIRGMSRTEEITDPSWNFAISKGFCSHEFIFEIVNIEEVKRSPKERTPYVVGLESESKVLVSPVIIRGKYAGAMVMFFTKTEVTNQHLELLLLANEVLTEIILKIPMYKYIRGNMNEGILMDLIEGRDKENADFKSWVLESELNCSNNLCVLVSEQNDANLYQEVIKDSLRDDLYHVFPKSHVIFYGNQMVILCMDLEKEKTEKGINRLKNFMEKHALRIGKSDFFQGIENFQSYYFQAGAAIRIGSAIHEEKRFFNYGDYKFFHLLEKVAGDAGNNLKDFVLSGLLTLEKYDKQHQSELFYTLNTLIDYGCNYKETCEALHIHRNTLSYRIDRIKSITRLELAEPKVQFDLAYSFRILEFLKHQ
jgi:sugar diacid utilization regulator